MFSSVYTGVRGSGAADLISNGVDLYVNSLSTKSIDIVVIRCYCMPCSDLERALSNSGMME